MGLRMQPRGAKFVTLISKVGLNVVERAVLLMEFVAAPHERWAPLATRLHDTEHAGDDTTYEMLLSDYATDGPKRRSWP